MSQIIELENNVEIIRLEKLKEKKFLHKSIRRVMEWLLSYGKVLCQAKVLLRCKVPPKRWPLSVSELRFELLNTKKAENKDLYYCITQREEPEAKKSNSLNCTVI